MSRLLSEEMNEEEVEEPSSSEVSYPSMGPPEDHILTKLLKLGIPGSYMQRGKPGFVEYVKEHPEKLQYIVSTLLALPEDIKIESASLGIVQKHCRQAVDWLRWAIFGGEPEFVIIQINKQIGESRGVCGAVWGHSDIAYRCRTCEHDPTCAICVSCFEAGDHNSHDYSMINTNGGCCDCGDITAWKESGFCSYHRGPGHAPPLPSSFQTHAKLAIQAFLSHWKEKLQEASVVAENKPRKWEGMAVEEKVALQTTLAAISLLLDFCNSSESMLKFAAEMVGMQSNGLIEVLLTAEHFLPKHIGDKLHGLLYKLMGDSDFKYRFAKAYITFYPTFLRKHLLDDSTTHVRQKESHSILSSFSVQIFTVPTITHRLVLECGLLDMLFDILKEFFLSCADEDGHFTVSRGQHFNLHRLCTLLTEPVDDIRYVMNHPKVARYVAFERPDLCRAWLHFLAYIQGMHPQRRITNIHVEEENDEWVSACILETQMANVHPLLVTGATCTNESYEADNKRSECAHPSGSLDAPTSSVPSEVESSSSKNNELVKDSEIVVLDNISLSAALIRLISECAHVLHAWLVVDASRELSRLSRPSMDVGQSPPQRRRVQLRGRMARGPAASRGQRRVATLENRLALRSSTASILRHEVTDMDIDTTVTSEPSDVAKSPECMREDWWMGTDAPAVSDLCALFEEHDWPILKFDVSKQEVSFHIPLHRMLALLLHRTLQECDKKAKAGGNELSVSILSRLLPERFRLPGFAAILMEHPLRLQVLCSQVHAGMWRRNGHSIIGLSDIYHSVQWCEDSLELDLFMLQSCASMAPTEEFVGRILSCFGLAEYFLLFLWRPNEYEAFLARDFLILIIRVVTERGFCGLSTKEILRRELIQRLAISDASHSALVKALPPHLHESEQLQEILDSVATYQAPRGMEQGKYVLKEECWKELDLYHPRWTLRELQCAEERYLRALKTSAVFLQLPHWLEPYAPLQGLALLAVSGRIHDVLRSVFFHAAYSPNLSDSRAPEGLLFTALHLLSLGLEICQMLIQKGRLVKSEVESSSSTNIVAETNLPLLDLAINRVCVGGADGTMMAEEQSTLSLLVMLMRKYILIENSHGEPIDTSQCNVSLFVKGLLRKFAELHRGCMYEIEVLAPEILHRVSHRPESCNASSSSEKEQYSAVELKKLKSRERQAAMMAKMKAAQEKFLASLESSETGTDSGKVKVESSKTDGKRPRELVAEKEISAEDAVAPFCALCRESGASSPLCILTFAQRSRLLALAEKPAPSWNNFEKVTQERRDPSNQLPSGEQASLISELSQFIQDAMADGPNMDRLTMAPDILDLIRNGLPSILRTGRIVGSPSRQAVQSISLVSESSEPSFPASDRYSEMDESRWWEHITDHDSEDLRDQALVTVLEEYVSSVSQEVHSEPAPEASQESFGGRMTRFTRDESLIPVETPKNRIIMDDNVGLHLSACGHSVHQDCLDRYLSSLLQRYYSRALFEGVHIVDPDMGEFLCPVCRRLANSFLPILEASSGADRHENLPFAMDRKASELQIIEAFRLLSSGEELMCKSGFRKALSLRLPEGIRGVLDTVIRRLCGLFYPERHHDTLSNGRNYQGLLLWDVFRYSLMSAELVARNRSFITGLQDPANRLVTLEEAADASRGSVLPPLLIAAKAIQNQSRQAILLRARGMQLLVGSICHGVSREFPDKSSKGNVLPIMQFLEQRQDYTDVQFWQRAADPIISRDPFSSFIWLLFCLPLTLPSSTSPFTSLVHLFYLVCIVQGISHTGELCTSDCGLSQKALDFLHVIGPHLKDASLENEDSEPKSWDRHPVHSIRRLTLPFLRRCALLQTLCSKSGSVVPVTSSHAWEVSNAHAWTNYMNEDDVELLELKELEELEKRFCIPPLSSILEDSYIQSVVLKWSEHFQQKLHCCKLPRPATASPFRLMDLPHRFQDLLQRFVKVQCPRCGKTPDKPALCLLCGVLCCGGSCCSDSNHTECTRHALSCGAGIGVFLMLKKTNVLLVRSDRQAMWPSPYLDAYGEEDQDMRRGKPLFLSHERYGALTNLVASHGLDYNSMVLQHTTRETMY